LLFSHIQNNQNAYIQNYSSTQNSYRDIFFLGSKITFETTASNFLNRIQVLTAFSTGNVAINTTTDAGFRLDVNGTARVQGNTTFLGTIAGSNAARFVIAAQNFAVNITSTNPTNGEGSLITTGAITTTDNQTKNVINVNNAVTSTLASFNTLNGFAFTSNINQTLGTIRGLFIAPTLTASTDFRAIETTAGNVLFGTTSGNVGIGTSTPSFKLDVVGDVRATQITTPLIYSTGTAELILATQGGTPALIVFPITRNVLIQNGGIPIDAGYKLDVNGTARVSGDVTSTGSFITTSRVGFSNNSRTITFDDANSGILHQGFGGHRFQSYNGSSYVEMFTIVGNQANLRIGINSTTPNASAVLDVVSTDKGFLPPRMTTTQRNAIASPAAGLMVYDTTLNAMFYFNGTIWI
jgi:hypothetical protein